MGTRRGWLGAAVALVVGCGPMEQAEREDGPDPAAPAEASDLGHAELAATTTTRTLTAYADTMADATQPDTRFGSAQTLYADASPRRQPYLRFNLSSINGVITSAKLRVYVVDGSKDGPAVYGVNPNWGVSTLTWNKAPAVLTQKLADVGAVSAGTWVDYDVSSWVKANDSYYAFTLVSTTSDGTGIEANDAPGSNNPRLVLTVQDCPGPETDIVHPHFDTWVSQAEPTRRNPGSKALTADGDPESAAYLSFDVATGGRTLTGARLRVFATGGGTANAPAVHATTNWSGEDFDWTGRPAVAPTPLADKGSVSGGTWVEYDVGAALSGDGRYGFGLLPQSTDGMTFTSMEGPILQWPQLVLSYTASTCAYRGLSRVGGTLGASWHMFHGGDERVVSTAATSDGGWVALGSYVSNGSANPPNFGGGPLPGIQGFAVTRYLENGGVEWSVGHAGQIIPAGLAVAPTGHILVVGLYYGAPDLGTGPLPQTTAARLFVARLTPDGVTEWVRTFASTYSGQQGMLKSTSITTDPDGAPIIAGRFFGEVDFGGGPLRSDGSQAQDGSALYLLKLAADGSHAWSRSFAAADRASQLEVAADSAGNLYLSGSALGGTELAPSGSGPTPFVARLTAAGEQVWTRAWTGANGATVAVVPYGGDVFFSGTFTGTFTFAGTTYTQVPTDYSGTPDDLFLGRLKADGTDVWLKHVGSPYGESARGLTVTRSGTVVLWAQSSGPVSFGGGTLRGGPIYAGYSTAGTHRWSRYFPLTGQPIALTTGELLLGTTLWSTTQVDGVSFSSYSWYGTTFTDDALFLRLRP
ncbi:DNRLRE domain-containing protein [Corallococcus sp. CA049B]|uniref:CBM96 family carbohydrate-binding protein n=1 Tax=Corallococcus sp. CA049B TaxID=2316730 RepID=UPI0011C43456|nr:DNRLRE domain-containing protein [Corallococcus sp. CA049B]